MSSARESLANGGGKLFSTVVVVVYVCLGLIAYGPSLPQIAHRVYSGLGDYSLFIWFLGWAPHAVVHGLNPFFSNAMFVPTGVNLAQNTEGPLLGWLLAPVTLTAGPIAAANLLMILAMPISAIAAFVVFRKWRIWGPAAAVGGLVYGFSPYMVGQALAHPVFLFVPLPPFIVSTLVSILQAKGHDRRLGVQLGLLLAAQYLISPEVFTSLCIVTGVGVIFAALRFRHRAFQVGRAVILPIGLALAVCLLVLAYPIWMLLAGPQHVSGSTYSVNNPFHSDLLSFVVPGSMQRVTLGMNPTDAGFLSLGTPVEAGSYVGIPVLTVAAFLIWRSRRSARMQIASVLFVSCAVLSLGSSLNVGGHSAHVPLPFWIVSHTPFLNNLLPVRISFEMSACLAAIFAFALDDLRQTSRSIRKSDMNSTPRPFAAALATGVVLVVLIATQLPRWPYGSNQAPMLPKTLSMTIPKGDPVALTYPYAYGSRSTLPLLWQASERYSFRILGGYSFHPAGHGHGSAIPNALYPNDLQVFLTFSEFWNTPVEKFILGKYTPSAPPPVTPNLVAATRTFLSKYHVQVIIVDRNYWQSMGAMKLFRHDLGEPTVSEGAFSMWKLSKDSSRR